MTDNRPRTRYGNEPINPDFGEGRWQDALRRMRDRIAGGLPLNLDDSNTIGDKHTHCSWGMCSEDREQWLDPEDHSWPEEFKSRGRFAPRDQQDDQFCPMDRKDNRQVEILGPSGCFYRCRMFSPKRVEGTREAIPDRKVALALYDEVIAGREAAHGKRSAPDDHESWLEV